ncbi:MAG: D-alanyl-D-alanine carboxypeptidase/D-alanyl-D-alanine-endopeptidase [Acidobacteriota bacterium]
MKGRTLIVAALLGTLSVATSGAAIQNGTAAPPELPAQIARILSHPDLGGARLGLRVQDVKGGEVLADYNSDELFAPASVDKIFTAAAALWRLSPSFVWQTPVAYRGRRADNTVVGDLWVLGRGAPDIVEEKLWLAARDIHDMGLVRVTGNLIVDDRYFDAERYGDGWPGGSQVLEAYHAPISALMADYAARREGSEWRAVDDAALHFGERFRAILELVGVRLEGRVRYPNDKERAAVPATTEVTAEDASVAMPEQLMLLYTIRSEPLGRLVLDLNKFSNNIVAESILKTLGAIEYGPPGTAIKGLAVVARFLDEELDIPINSYIQADGSGLSGRDRFSPQQVVDLLTYAYSDFHLGPEFVSSLKLSGLDGWNPRAFKNPPLVGEMRLKSGHIKGVNTLSGYAHTDSGRIVAFCIMINGHHAAQWQVDQRMAEISRVILSTY